MTPAEPGAAADGGRDAGFSIVYCRSARPPPLSVVVSVLKTTCALNSIYRWNDDA
jgi:hypothetical protein